MDCLPRRDIHPQPICQTVAECLITMPHETSAMAEITHIVTGFQKEKKRIRQAIDTLYSEKQNLEEMHRILEDALSDTNRKIGEKTIYLTNQLKTSIIESERRIRDAESEANGRIEKKTEELSNFVESSKKLIGTLKEDLDSFRGDLVDKLNVKFGEIQNKQNDFQMILAKKISVKISEETSKMRDSIEKNTNSKVDEYLHSQAVLVDNLTKQFDVYDRQVETLEKEVEKVRNDHQEWASKMSVSVKKVVQLQKEHENAIQFIRENQENNIRRLRESHDNEIRHLRDNQEYTVQYLRDRIDSAETLLTDKLESMETRIAELEKPKGFFSFLRRKPKSAPPKKEDAEPDPVPAKDEKPPEKEKSESSE